MATKVAKKEALDLDLSTFGDVDLDRLQLEITRRKQVLSTGKLDKIPAKDIKEIITLAKDLIKNVGKSYQFTANLPVKKTYESFISDGELIIDDTSYNDGNLDDYNNKMLFKAKPELKKLKKEIEAKIDKLSTKIEKLAPDYNSQDKLWNLVDPTYLLH